MPLYHATLVRSYTVTIESKSEKEASGLAEFFVGFADFSDIADREKFQFEIKKIELIENDTIDVTLANND
jgi:hypothetical protein